MKRLFNYLDLFLTIISLSALAIMTIIVIVSVFLRYFFGMSYVWSEELMTLLFIFTTFFGSVLAIKEKGHIAIDYFLQRLPDSAQKVVNIIFDLIIAFIQIQITRMSLSWIGQAGNVLSAGLRIPFRYIYLILPLSSVLMVIYCVFDIFQELSLIDSCSVSKNNQCFGKDGV